MTWLSTWLSISYAVALLGVLVLIVLAFRNNDTAVWICGAITFSIAAIPSIVALVCFGLGYV